MSLVGGSGCTLTQGKHGPELRLFPGLWLVIHRVAAPVRQWALWVLNPAPWHSVQQVDASYTEQRSWDICSPWKHCRLVVTNLQKLRRLLLHMNKNSRIARVWLCTHRIHPKTCISMYLDQNIATLHWILILTNLKAHLDKYPQMTEMITVHCNVTIIIIKSWYLIWWLGRSIRGWCLRVKGPKHTGHKMKRQVSEVRPEQGPTPRCIWVEHYILNCALRPRVFMLLGDSAVKG